jgi:hypothetical protein
MLLLLTVKDTAQPLFMMPQELKPIHTIHTQLLLMMVLKSPPKLMKMDQSPLPTPKPQPELASLLSLMKADQSLKFTHLMVLPMLLHQPPHQKQLLDQQSLKMEHMKLQPLPQQEQSPLSLMILEPPLSTILIVKEQQSAPQLILKETF